VRGRKKKGAPVRVFIIIALYSPPWQLLIYVDRKDVKAPDAL
jgi:hypothetical protein